MSASPSSELHPPVPEAPAAPQLRTVIRRRLRTVAALPAPSDVEEAAFWAHLEDREEGRVALEVDHLFDTSYAWSV